MAQIYFYYIYVKKLDTKYSNVLYSIQEDNYRGVKIMGNILKLVFVNVIIPIVIEKIAKKL